MSFTEKYRALRNCARWNEKQAERYSRHSRKVKNHDAREECFRNVNRHSRNAARLNKLLETL